MRFFVPVLVMVVSLFAPASASELKSFSPASLAAAQAAGKPIVIHVTATWCSVCHVQKRVLNSLLKQPRYQGLVVLDLDFDNDKAEVQKLRVQAQSTFVAFKGKMQVGRSSGDTEPKRIAHLFDQTL